MSRFQKESKGFKNKNNSKPKIIKKENDINTQILEATALEYIQKNSYQKASNIYEKLIGDKSNNPIVYSNLASIYWSQNKIEKARDRAIKNLLKGEKGQASQGH